MAALILAMRSGLTLAGDFIVVGLDSALDCGSTFFMSFGIVGGVMGKCNFAFHSFWANGGSRRDTNQIEAKSRIASNLPATAGMAWGLRVAPECVPVDRQKVVSPT